MRVAEFLERGRVIALVVSIHSACVGRAAVNERHGYRDADDHDLRHAMTQCGRIAHTHLPRGATWPRPRPPDLTAYSATRHARWRSLESSISAHTVCRTSFPDPVQAVSRVERLPVASFMAYV